MNILRKATLATLFAATGAPAPAAVIDFDDIAFPGCCTYLVPGYAGFAWSGGEGAISWVVGEQNATPDFPGAKAHSGSNYAWSNGGTSLSLRAAGGGTFDLASLWARGGYGDMVYNITAFRGGVAVASDTVDATTDDACEFLGFEDVDAVTLTGSGGNLLIDDIDTGRATGAVPEPAGAVLMLAGLGAIGVAGRRRRNSPGPTPRF